jgi:CBS domain-containing protein
MKIADICSRNVITIDGEEAIVEAARRMREYHVGALVVIDRRRSGRRPVGILTDRDLVVSVLAEDPEDLDRLLVSDVMTADPVTVTPDQSLDEALDRMRAAGARRLPVVDPEGALVGLVSFDDITDVFARQIGLLASVLQTEQSREWQRRS